MTDYREQAVKDVSKATHWSVDDVKLFVSSAGTENDDGDDLVYVYAVAQREARLRLEDALQQLAGCDWVISLPDRMDAVRAIARAALEAVKEK